MKTKANSPRSLATWIALLVMILGVINAGAADAPLAKKIVVLGDSLAAGYGVDTTEAFPAVLQEKITAEGRSDLVVNAGVSGDTTADGLSRLDWLLKRKIDVLLLELGGNDGLRGLPISATTSNLQAMIDGTKKKYPQVKIVLAGMYMPPNLGEKYTVDFQQMYQTLATKNNLPLVPFLLDGVGGHPELNQADHIHPTPAGHKIVAENVWKVLGPVLEK